MKKISRRFNGLLIISISVSVLCASVLSTALLLFKMDKDNHQRNQMQVQSLADNLEIFLENAFYLNFQLSINPIIIQGILNADPQWESRRNRYLSDKPENFPEDRRLLESLLVHYSWVELFFVQDDMGLQTARSSGPVGDRSQRWWFREILEDSSKKPFISRSYFSMTGNTPVSSVFHPVYSQGEFIGIMGTDINFETLQTMVDGYLYADDLEAFIIDSSGTVIAYHDSSLIYQMYNLKDNTCQIPVYGDNREVLLDDSGFHLTEEHSADISIHLQKAASKLLEGETGSMQKVLLDKVLSSVYYSPVYYPGASRDDLYGVILVNNHRRLVRSVFLIIFGVSLFIIISSYLLYKYFHRLFQQRILDPLSILIDSMKDGTHTKYQLVSLNTGDEFDLLAETYNTLRINLAKAYMDLREKMEELRIREKGYRAFADISLAMSDKKNHDDVLKLIVTSAMELCRAEGGSLYLYNDDNKTLDFKVIQNSKLDIQQLLSHSDQSHFRPVPLFIGGEKDLSHVSAYCAHSGELVNISDVYNCRDFNFEGMKSYDRENRYRSQSMLVIPMKNIEGELVGVLQLINAKNEQGDIIEFTEHHQNIITVLGSQGAVTLTNILLNINLQDFLYSFIRSIATAVDEKSAYTSGHIERVVTLSHLLAESINRQTDGIFKDTFFNKDQMEEIKIAAWMHDVGKITIPEYILDKSKKLMSCYDGFSSILHKSRILSLGWERQVLVNLLKEVNPDYFETRAYKEYVEKRSLLEDALQEIKRSNDAEYPLDESSREKILSYRSLKLKTEDFTEYLISDEELENLLIKQGTLNDKERKIVESHVEITQRILKQLKFPSHLNHVPDYAAQHHEKLDGSGYFMSLSKEDLPVQSRIIAVSDIFEALTARDRPYRKAIELDDAIAIMEGMVRDGHIDGSIFHLLRDTGIIQEYLEIYS